MKKCSESIYENVRNNIYNSDNFLTFIKDYKDTVNNFDEKAIGSNKSV